jgi:hypothetical protein
VSDGPFLPPTAPPPAVGEAPPRLVNQVGPNGTWRAHQLDATSGGMTWIGGPDGPFDRLDDQVHDEGTWRAGPGASMSWIVPTPDPESEDPQ